LYDFLTFYHISFAFFFQYC